MSIGKLKFIFFFFLLLLQGEAFSIDVERFEKLRTADGHSESAIISTFCDSRGFLWFGTRNGLHRYDGHQIHTYKKKHNDIYSIQNNRVTKIWEDLNGFIWTETHDGHYNYLDVTTDQFHSFPKKTELKSNKNVRISSFLHVDKNEIWIGTDNSGIYHLTLGSNGIYDFKQYGARSNNSISNNRVSFIVSDSESIIWIGTANGVNRVIRPKAPGEDLNFQHFLIDHSFTSAVNLNEKVWFGTSNKGLVFYDLISKQFSSEVLINKDSQISVLQKARSGNLIIGTENSGLIIANPGLNETLHFFKNQKIKRIYQDKKGILWLVMNNKGISRLNLNNSIEQHFEIVPKENSNLFIDERQIFFEDREGNLWIGSHGGGLSLFKPENNSFQFFRNEPGNDFSLSSNVINSITQDKSGLIWIGTGSTDGGLHKLIPKNPLFKQIEINESFNNLSDNLTRSIFQDRNNNIWVGTKTGHITIYNEEYELIHLFDPLQTLNANIPISNIYTIMQDKEGYVWIGSKGSGISVSELPLQNYKSYSDINFHSYKYDPNDPASLSSNYIYSIIQDKQGLIWIGNYGGGINQVIGRTSTKLSCARYSSENSNLSSDEIRYIFEDDKERIWFATTYGLNLLDKSNSSDSTTFIAFNYEENNPNSLVYNDVVHIFEDSKNRLWFGTYAGVSYLIDNDKPQSGFNSLTSENGLINDVIYGITEDKDGNLWFSTQNGISRYNPENQKFDNFNNSNGLYFSKFCENTSSSLKNGQLAFGNTSGLLIISPDQLKLESFSPPLCFTRFWLFNEEVFPNTEDSPLIKNINYTDELVLQHNQSSFSIEFSALSFFDPQKNRYSYILENFDDNWYNVQNERKATFTKVPPGKYTFKVKASTRDGSWTENPKEISIQILQPWWKTNPAYIAYFLIFVMVFEFSRRTYLSYYRLQTDLRVQQRVNEIKLEFFTNISHEIRTPLTLILGPLEDLKNNASLPESFKTPVNIMSRNSKRILRLVNQLLDFRKIQNKKMKLKVQKVEVCTFINEICLNFEQLAIQKNISFTYPTPGHKEYVWIDKSKIDSVLFNILSNAFKFSKNDTNIDLKVKKEENSISIAVRDEGLGMSKEKTANIFKRFYSHSGASPYYSGSGIGLAYSYELMKMHKGTIEVQSKLREGSTFTIIIPTGKEHLINEETIFLDKESSLKYSHAKEYSLDNIAQLAKKDQEKSQKKQTIVIVEDNIEVINYLEFILKEEFITYHAFNGMEGIKLIKKIHPDLIISDLMMPEMDGIRMTKELKNDFTVSHIPIIMLTAKSAMDDQIQGIETGAEAYVLKPFNSKYLISVINNLLKQREILVRKFNDKSFSSEIKITNKDEEFLKKTINIIEENCLDEEFNVSILIKKSLLGRTVFFNKIKGLTGHSPVEFIRKIKLQIAAKYLEQNNCSVSEAAYSSGFNSLKYFTKCFKKEYGVNPSEYKKNVSKSPIKDPS